MTAQPPRLFTLEEARAAIPTIEPLVRLAQQKADEIQAMQMSRGRGSEETSHTNGHRPNTEQALAGDRDKAEQLLTELQRLIEQIHSHGCEMKDPLLGLLDFRSLREDRVVYLCWRLGEATIEYWHELDTGYAGRQRL